MFPFRKKKKKTTEKKAPLIERIIAVAKQVYEGYSFESTVYNRIITVIKISIVATRKFMLDDCLTKASAIAYTTITSLIPTLTVYLTFMSVFSGAENKKDELFRDISLFLTEYNIKLDMDAIFMVMSGLIDNAKAIGTVGILIVFFTATATLRALEKSLNDIWRVKQGRTIFQKIVYYWAALTLAPVMLIIGTTVAAKLSDSFSSANYNSIYISDNKTWVVGNKGSIIHSNKEMINFFPLDDANFDYEDQRIYTYNQSDNTFTENDVRLDNIHLSKEEYNSVRFIEDEGWIVSSKGVILYTKDKEDNWSISKWGNFVFNDILMINNRKGFIAANGGIILTTDTGGENWTVYDTLDPTLNFKSISHKDGIIIIAANKGKILYSNNGGSTWDLKVIDEAKKNNNPIDLNAVYFVDRKSVWIAGNDGIILNSYDGGITWNHSKFKEYNYYAVVFLDRDNGFAAGEKGVVIYTENGGKNWKSRSLPTHKINKLAYLDNTTWAIGDGAAIQKNAANRKKWSGSSGKSVFAMITRFLAPFVFIWIFFLLAYSTLPNIKVPFKYSAIGAAFTGTVWVIFIFLFIVYIKAFANGTFAIYGALAAIPLFLLMVYTSALIILYGAEVSFTMMHPETYINLKNFFEDSAARIRKVNIYFGLVAIQSIYFKFESGKGGSTYSELLKNVNHNSIDLDHFLHIFADNKLIANDSEGAYIPTNSSSNIKLSAIFDLVNEAALLVPKNIIKKNQSRENVRDIFNELSSSRNKILGDISLKDLEL
ncbi:MAG: YihY/virulence factor BrkB family protein [Leptospirales bacterium]|nr:YihY/virulence factor BrkB family protein [Leptospirales bacterium]